MPFVTVASVKDLPQGSSKGVEVNGKQIFLANIDGGYYAIDNICTHMGCMLSDGTLSAGTITCICHGSVFDVKDGKVLKGPARKPETVYEVKVEGDQILVNV